MKRLEEKIQGFIETPFGAVKIFLLDHVLELELTNKHHKTVIIDHPQFKLVQKMIQAYLNKSVTQIKLSSMPLGTSYQKKVWQALVKIPYGQTKTYGEIAKTINSGPRAVANACGANPWPILVPCHRVIAKEGIGGFMRGRKKNYLKIKSWLLQHERLQ
jgi:methylated-DNA-[protein]-cysteine S-methyltransferase